MSLSDTFCVDRYRAEFLELIRGGSIDIVVANVHELRSLYETGSFEAAMGALRADCGLAAVTASEKGSYIVTFDGVEHVPAAPVERVVDVTGAGDLYAAGFLLGAARGMPFKRAAALGSLAAAEVISHFGARPQTSLKALAAAAGFTLDDQPSRRPTSFAV
jgi:adenosine kinase